MTTPPNDRTPRPSELSTTCRLTLDAPASVGDVLSRQGDRSAAARQRATSTTGNGEPPAGVITPDGGSLGPMQDGPRPRGVGLRPLTPNLRELRALRGQRAVAQANGFVIPAPCRTAMPDGRMTDDAT